MSEITRFLEKRGVPPSFLKFVAEFTVTLYEGLNTFGKRHNGGTIQAWAMVLNAKGVTDPAEILVAVEHFLNGSALPTPGEFATWVLEQRHRESTATILELTRQQCLREEAAKDRELAERYSDVTDGPSFRNQIERLTMKLTVVDGGATDS